MDFLFDMPCDYSKYPTNWFTEIRPAILKRAGDCCEKCGVKNYELIWRDPKNKELFYYWPEGMESEAWTLDGRKAIKIILTISHTDHDTSNNDYNNLKALCQLHHLRHDIGYHKQTRNRNKGLQSLF